MCLAVDQTFNPILNKNEMDELMNLLRSNYGISNVVVLWCEVSEAITIIKEANKRGSLRLLPSFLALLYFFFNNGIVFMIGLRLSPLPDSLALVEIVRGWGVGG